MKNLLFTITTLLMATAAFAGEIQAARIDASQKNIEVDVRYGGGCHEHQFELQMEECFESMPVKCSAKLVDVTVKPDLCTAIMSKTVVLNLASLGMDTSYYASGSLTISGVGNSTATVKMPAQSEKQDGKIKCTTHTSANLEIIPTQKTVLLKAITGEKARYEITTVKFVSIETFPAIDQTTYSLNDGRKVVTEFKSKKGIGYWIRTNGEASPEFPCERD